MPPNRSGYLAGSRLDAPEQARVQHSGYCREERKNWLRIGAIIVSIGDQLGGPRSAADLCDDPALGPGHLRFGL